MRSPGPITTGCERPGDHARHACGGRRARTSLRAIGCCLAPASVESSSRGPAIAFHVTRSRWQSSPAPATRSSFRARKRASPSSGSVLAADDHQLPVAELTARSPSAHNEHPLAHNEASPEVSGVRRRCASPIFWRVFGELCGEIWLARAKVGVETTEPKVRGSNPLGRATGIPVR
jgi:hypothetical protein